jgi:protein-arginine deiminase
LFRGVESPLAPWAVSDAAALRAGVRLGLEARDIIRDPAVWDGTTTITLT